MKTCSLARTVYTNKLGNDIEHIFPPFYENIILSPKSCQEKKQIDRHNSMKFFCFFILILQKAEGRENPDFEIFLHFLIHISKPIREIRVKYWIRPLP
jgi:hypothetical protein